VSELKARVAAHLGVEPVDLLHVVERGDQIVVIYSDYRKAVFPISILPEAAREAVVMDAPTPKARRKPGL
jgi:hypothetical protein